MSVTASSQGASATPATDFRTTLGTKLTNAGWTLIETVSSGTAGTTGDVKVYASPSTTTAADGTSTVYTGCIILIEASDTSGAAVFPSGSDTNGPAIRIRCAERYTSSGNSANANKVRYAAPGIQTITTSNTPNANNATTDNWLAIFQAPGTSALTSVGWIHLRTSAAGFNYWIGAQASPDRLLAAVNTVAGSFGLVGRVETLLASGDASAVFIMGTVHAAVSNCGWQAATSNGQVGNCQSSREPLTTTATGGAFQFMNSGYVDALSQTTSNNAANSPTGTINNNSRYHTNFVAQPLLAHGVNATTSWAPARAYRMKFSNFISAPSSADAASGDTVTVGSTAYIVLGSSITNGGIRMLICVHPTSGF